MSSAQTGLQSDLVGAIIAQAEASQSGAERASAKDAGSEKSTTTTKSSGNRGKRLRTPSSAYSKRAKLTKDVSFTDGAGSHGKNLNSKDAIPSETSVHEADSESRDDPNNKSNKSATHDGSAHGPRSSRSSRSHGNYSKSFSDHSVSSREVQKDMNDMKEQLCNIQQMLASLTPVVSELKRAYDASINSDQEGEPPEKRQRLILSDDEESLFEESYFRSTPANDDSNADSDSSDSPAKEKPSETQVSQPQGLQCLKNILAAVTNDEVRGPKVHDDVAKIMNTVLYKGMPKEVLEDMVKLYHPPENCTYMTQIKCNQRLWGTLRPLTKYNDKIMQNWQTNIFHGLTPFLEIADACSKHLEGEGDVPSPETLLAKMTDGFSILAAVVHDISMFRRELAKPDINEKYKALASPQNPVTKELFGDNLDANMKDIEEGLKISNKVQKKIARPRPTNIFSKPRVFPTRATARYDNKKAGSFLGGKNQRSQQNNRKNWTGKKFQKKEY
ncbi:uncharacterized protein LOC106163723 [Lingula anatina]|uniref:Uncharacterized protein LOC106163723 n=1 Tax=Lingula anatina TaxID=7574 RepID=A0A1S3IF03_LINAN|nr:uncharacterized protein LOC106163723 [Lingula anatina]|eukprot:XP_013396845.1 uncharacterized protein LOC106163723 [Lingula anatina]